jgi:hypothetical protein
MAKKSGASDLFKAFTLKKTIDEISEGYQKGFDVIQNQNQLIHDQNNSIKSELSTIKADLNAEQESRILESERRKEIEVLRQRVFEIKQVIKNYLQLEQEQQLIFRKLIGSEIEKYLLDASAKLPEFADKEFVSDTLDSFSKHEEESLTFKHNDLFEKINALNSLKDKIQNAVFQLSLEHEKNVHITEVKVDWIKLLPWIVPVVLINIIEFRFLKVLVAIVSLTFAIPKTIRWVKDYIEYQEKLKVVNAVYQRIDQLNKEVENYGKKGTALTFEINEILNTEYPSVSNLFNKVK